MIGYCAVISPIASIIITVQLLIVSEVDVDDKVKLIKVEVNGLSENSCIEGVTTTDGHLSTRRLNLA